MDGFQQLGYLGTAGSLKEGKSLRDSVRYRMCWALKVTKEFVSGWGERGGEQGVHWNLTLCNRKP